MDPASRRGGDAVRARPCDGRVHLSLEADRRRRLLLVGDAFAFLDPLFSTGVFLALKSGEIAADAIHAALSSTGEVSAGDFPTTSRTSGTP